MMWKAIFCVAVACGATAVAAQEPAFRIDATENCLQEAVGQAERVACIGAASHACLSDPDNGGGSFVGSFCYQEESNYWDSRLNASYQVIMADAKVDSPALADALLKLQRAWIVYRDARCQAVFDAWGEGTGRSPAYAECLMRMTAEQTLFLEGGL